MKKKPGESAKAAPHLEQMGAEFQKFGTVVPLPNSLEIKACSANVEILNQLLADTITLRDMYKKHHWQVSGPTFYQLHLLYDKHFEEQSRLVDELAERIQLLGGVSIAMAADVAEATAIERPPRGREAPPIQISRLLAAHQQILETAHEGASVANDNGDDGTNDLIVSSLIRTNEFQVWFLSQSVVATPMVTMTESEEAAA
ncbi:MAG: DNA starvation/stationary phase protection protein [Bryobacteraceae bacterium]